MEKFENFFSPINPNLLSLIQHLFSSCISNVNNANLCRIPNILEVHDIAKSMHPTKFLGLDVFRTLFFQKYWRII